MANLPIISPSRMHRYAVGVVIDDNLDNKSEIKIYPIELIVNVNSDLTKDKTISGNSKAKVLQPTSDVSEVSYTEIEEVIEFPSTSYLLASWIKGNNQITPPNVCKGERVIVYRYGNNDEYYWDVELTDLSLRKEEHVIYSFSDKPNLEDEEDPIEDRYTITVSAKEKRLTIKTTDKYGEFTTYKINLDTKGGKLDVVDGIGNTLIFNSALSAFKFHLEGKKTNYDFEAIANDGTFVFKDKQKNSISLNSNSSDLTFNINNSVTFNTKTFNVNSTDFNISTSDYNLKSVNNIITSTKTEYVGGIIGHDGILIDKNNQHYGNLGFLTSPPVMPE